MTDKIWLSSPHMGGNELRYIHDAFNDNWIAPLGPNVDGFEMDLATFLNVEHRNIAALSSGTAALHLALILCGVGPGDEVICQSMTFSASANPIAYLGATPVFIDSENDTWNICPNFLREAIVDRINKGKKPKAIIGVHLYGMPFKVDKILEVANEFDIPLIEDAAEALGSTYKGKFCGTFGKFGILSFNGNKIITTSGGGALVCQNSIDKEKAVFLSTQARDEAPHYQHSNIGYNYRMSNICAGIGRGQMEVLNQRVSARREMNFFYRNIFEKYSFINVFKEPSKEYHSNHWLSTVTIDFNMLNFSLNEVRQIFLNKNIETRPLWKPMHLQPIFAECPYYGSNIAETLFQKGLCLPSGSNLNEIEKQRIKDVIKIILNES